MHNLIIITAILFLIVVASRTIYGFVIGAPILFSPKKAVIEALTECQVKPGENFYDLGSGTGRSMLIAAKKFNLNIYGFELSPPLALIAKCNLWLHGIRKSTIYLKNFYLEDLNNADIVFCFLTPKAMLKLREKFEKELKPGTKIISYAFSIPDWIPEKVIVNGSPGKIFCYIKK
jgi:predicted RNA methylase